MNIIAIEPGSNKAFSETREFKPFYDLLFELYDNSSIEEWILPTEDITENSLPPDIEYKNVWGSESLGLGKRASAYFNQIEAHKSKIWFEGVYINTTYEAFRLGVIKITSEQIWGDRMLTGYMPVLQYITSGGRKTSMSIKEAEDDGFFIEKYENQYLTDSYYQLKKLTGFIKGWKENTDTVGIFSVGEYAQETILKAISEIQKKDPFWFIERDEMDLYISLS